MSRFFSIVDQHVGRNPVARAVAMAGLSSSMRTFQISLYGIEDGSEQASKLITASEILAVALRIRELQGSTAGVPVLRGAESAILQRAQHGFKWRSADAVAIDVAMGEAQKAVASATARQVQDAWLFVRQQEAEACSASAARSL